MRPRKNKILVGDFETTVYKGQTETEVWASAVVELYTEDVKIFHSINETWDYLANIRQNVIIYYHNLKFDGSFWIPFFMHVLNYKQAYTQETEYLNTFRWVPEKEMENGTFSYNISDMGQWYRITARVNNHYIEFRDSLKLLPFSVKTIGESFGTKHKKSSIEYTGYRYAGCEITDEEKKYIANDVLVVKEALETMYDEGHTFLTIGSCCLEEYRKSIGKYLYDDYFPDVYKEKIDERFHTYENAGEWIKRSYRGGWCYLVTGKENKVYQNGTTADVNSLYPSMMSSESGNKYPVGRPIMWRGNRIPDIAKTDDYYYFVRFKTRFYLKPGKLPFIQIKNNWLYKPREMLITSDVKNSKNGKYYREYWAIDGTIKQAIVELTMTQTDFALFLDHYDVEDFEILDGCYFQAVTGLFDKYIDKYRKIKQTSKGAKRMLAKMFLNSLYGKTAAGTRSDFKVAYTKEDGSLGYFVVPANDKKPGYIPVGAAITSYGRNFTIRAAQANYYGPDKPGFIYADTDSIHCDLPPEEIKGIKVDDNEFCCWKLESCWDNGIFVRQKTYIEHVTEEDLQSVEPYYNVKCAGMPERCKNLFVNSITQDYDPSLYTEEAQEFMKTKRDITDFKIGLVIPGKLVPRQIPGGTILVDTTYELR